MIEPRKEILISDVTGWLEADVTAEVTGWLDADVLVDVTG